MSNNHPYKIIPDRITKLAENQIFVFGSNTQGRHGAGSALFARQYCNAEYGNPQGRQGQSWAMMTKDLNKGIRSIPQGIYGKIPYNTPVKGGYTEKFGIISE
ncbi:MAG: hypothetical protein ACIWVG_30365 [Gloeotrichia echinulata HAB0833]